MRATNRAGQGFGGGHKHNYGAMTAEGRDNQREGGKKEGKNNQKKEK